MPALYVLYETAAGFSLFEVIGLDELGQSAEAVQQSTLDLTRFGKVWYCCLRLGLHHTRDLHDIALYCFASIFGHCVRKSVQP
jgi:hypothetical protein